MYTKDFIGTLSLFTSTKQSGVLYVDPPETNKSWYAYLLLDEGKVTSCQVQDTKHEQLLHHGNQALTWLNTFEELSWHFESAGHSSSFAKAFPHDGRPDRAIHPAWPVSSMQPDWHGKRPRRTAKGEQEWVHAAMSRSYRFVFSLVDGQKTPEEIASILHKSLDEVWNTLNDLKTQRFIE